MNWWEEIDLHVLATFVPGTRLALFGGVISDSGSPRPLGPELDSQVVDAEGNILFKHLQEGESYSAGAVLGDTWHFISFQIPTRNANKVEIENMTLIQLKDVEDVAYEDEEVPTWTEAVSTRKPRKLTYRNLMDAIYGAKSDGSASIKGAFEAALIDSIGRTLYMPRGSYLASGLVVPDGTGITLLGDGEDTRFLHDGVNDALLKLGSHSKIEGCSIDGNRRAGLVSAGHGVFTSFADDVEIAYMYGDNMKGEFIHFGNPGAHNIHHNQVTDPGLIGIRGELNETTTQDASEIYVQDNFVGPTTFDLESNQVRGIKLSKHGAPFNWEGARVIGNSVRRWNEEGVNKGGMGIEIEAPLDPMVRDNLVTGGSYGISLARPTGGQIIGNTVKGTQTIGIESSGSSGTQTIGNRIEGQGLLPTGISVNDNSGNRRALKTIVAENIVDGCTERCFFGFRPESLQILGNSFTHEVEGSAAVVIQVTAAAPAARVVISGNDVSSLGRCLLFEGGNTVQLTGSSNTFTSYTIAAVALKSGTFVGSLDGSNFLGEGVNHEVFAASVATKMRLGGYAPQLAAAKEFTVKGIPSRVRTTGATAIESIVPTIAGHVMSLAFTAGATVVDGENLKLAGNFEGAGGRVLTLVCDGTNWEEISRSTN